MVVEKLVDIEKVQKEFNKTFDKINKSLFGELKRPYTNIVHNNRLIIIFVELPKMEKEDISVKLFYNKLEIRALKKESKVKKTKTSYEEKKEIKGYFRKINLPGNLKLDQIVTKFHKNNLKIIIPKVNIKEGSNLNID